MSVDPLKEVRELLRAKRYAEARVLLRDIDHPTAKGWLAKLDEVAPERKPKPARSAGKPWNPNTLVFFTFFLSSIVSGIALSLNWRRLGKPQWMKISLALTFALPALAFGVIFLLALNPSVTKLLPAMSWVAIVVALATTNLATIVGTGMLQNGAYKKWQRDDNQAMLTHEYPVERTAILMMVVVAVATISISVYSVLRDRPLNFDSANVSIIYPPAWDVVDTTTEATCQTQGTHCIGAFSLSPFHFTSILIFQFDVGDGVSASSIVENVNESLQTEYTGYRFLKQQTRSVGGYSASSLHYTMPNTGNQTGSYYVEDLYIVVNHTGFEFFIVADNPGIYREALDRIDTFLEGVRFKGLTPSV